MNNVQYLLDKIKERVPIEILNLCFLPKPMYNVLPITIEDSIRKKIIIEKVLRDCNLFGGVETYVDISLCRTEMVDTGNLVYVGFEPTGGRKIVSALSVGFAGIMTGSVAPTIASAVANPYVMTDVRIEIVGDNIIYLDGYIGARYSVLKCILNRDDDFASIPQRAIPTLGDMAVYAAKSHIYITLKIKLSSAEIVQGVDIGVIKEMVDEYADAYDMYQELLVKWRRISIMADKPTKMRLIRALVPSS
jgi:hypothetical protein